MGQLPLALRERKLRELAFLLTREALSPRMPDALCEALSDALPGWIGMVAYDGADSLPVELSMARLPLDQWSKFRSYFWRVNPVPTAIKRAGLWNATTRTSDLIRDQDLRATEYYNDFLRPAGLRWLAGMGVVLTNGNRLNIALLRGDHDGGDYSDAEIQWLRQVRVFVRSAFELRRLAGVASAGTRSSVNRIGSVLRGAALLNTRGRQIPLNSAGEERLRRGSSGPGDRPGLGAPLSWPVAGDSLFPATSTPGPDRLLVFEEVRATPTTAAETLTQAFDLTRAEACVGVALIDGLTYREIADRHGVSYHTVHAQIRMIYRKAGVRSARQFAVAARGAR